jgi:hypothetical protein
VRDIILPAAEFTAINPILRAGQQGVESDTGRSKSGDGATAWRVLAYSGGGGGGSATAKLWVGAGNPTGYTDLFNRANSTTTLGSPWSALVGVWGINGNAAYPVSGVGSSTSVAAVDGGLADGKVTATMAAAAVAGNEHGIAFRVVDASNFCALVQTTTFGGWVLRAVVAGSTVSSTFVFASYAAGTVIRLDLSGSSVAIRANGTLISTVTLPYNLEATKVGFVAPNGSSVARWDSIVVDANLTGVATNDMYFDRLTSQLYGPYSAGWPSTTARTNRNPRYTTAGRPGAASLGAGSCYFDTTLNKPVWSDGTVYRDATGTTV